VNKDLYILALKSGLFRHSAGLSANNVKKHRRSTDLRIVRADLLVGVLHDNNTNISKVVILINVIHHQQQMKLKSRKEPIISLLKFVVPPRLVISATYWVSLQFAPIFTALHGMQTRSSDEDSVCLSVRLSNVWIVTKRN